MTSASLAHMEPGPEPVLAYVKDGLCYFVSDLKAARGDDWNDAPYEHNAGPPYAEFVTTTLYVRGDFETPDGRSVDDINAGAAPWLGTSRYAPDTDSRVYIYSGTPINEFMRKAWLAGWTVYIPLRMRNAGADSVNSK